ncbi:MAG: phosphatidylglycerophosphatase A [Verrucomicrobiota bacterium]|jgi:phosphatidylglycerophosphatase A|nr:phosphatidylglycerophosphatase A [Verrucomicrobiota bacterium]
MNRLLLWIAQGGGLGRVPKIPGTVGTLGGFPLTALLLLPESFWAYLSGCVLCIPFSVWICGEAERILDKKDPASVVLDEIIAVPICFLGIFGAMKFSGLGEPTLEDFFKIPNWWAWIIAAFLLFRLFDIWKPGPINTIQKMKNGWGVTMDDVFAGVVVSVILGAVFFALQ